MSAPHAQIGVLGAGSWGTALAKVCAENGHAVTLWAREPEVVEEINFRKLNSLYLPDISLPIIKATDNPVEAVKHKDLILSVIPSHGLREVWKTASTSLTENALVVNATKGIEDSSGEIMTEVLHDTLPQLSRGQIVTLSGPSFATEVAQRLPTAVVIASYKAETAKRAQHLISNDTFRVYTSDDVVGVELGGALKNVLAIAVGIAEGLGFGYNTRAALMTRGLSEITQLAVARGANPLTLAGLAGIGDLVLTCTSMLSRNHQVGVRLGRGESLNEVTQGLHGIAEGIKVSKAAHGMAKKLQIDSPIIDAVYDILYHGGSPAEITNRLMSRPLQAEIP